MIKGDIEAGAILTPETIIYTGEHTYVNHGEIMLVTAIQHRRWCDFLAKGQVRTTPMKFIRYHCEKIVGQ